MSKNYNSMFTFEDHRLVTGLEDIPAGCKIILLSEYKPPPEGDTPVGTGAISQSILKNMKLEPNLESEHGSKQHSFLTGIDDANKSIASL